MKRFPKTLLIVSIFLVFTAFVAYKLYGRYQKHYFQPDVTVIGYVEMADGLGRQSVELIDAIKDTVSVRFESTRGRRNGEGVPERVQKIINKRCFRLGDVIIYEDHPTLGGESIRRKMSRAEPHQIRLAYSMIESTAIPPEWVADFNRFFDAVIVPDPFLIDVYQNSGVRVPIFYLPLGRDFSSFLQEPIKKERHDPFVFGSCSSCIGRKNHIGLVKAFVKAFGNRPDVQLHINANRYIDYVKKDLLDYLKTIDSSNISVTFESLDDQSYLEFFKKIDCLVNLSKGEGFSNQPREAMAMGIPVVVTNNTAQSTIAQSGLVGVVASNIVEPAVYEVLKNLVYGSQFNFEIDDAAAALRDVYDHYEDYLAKSEAAREWVAQYDFSSLRSLYRSLVNPQRITLGAENQISESGITTNSTALYNKYAFLKKKKILSEQK